METPTPPQFNNCLNCGEPLSERAKYCPACGQKNTSGKISLASIMGDVWENLVNLDLKIFRTIPALFIPGKLTKEFFKGKHKRYVHPFRIFLLMVLAFLAILNFLIKDEEIQTSNIGERLAKVKTFKDFQSTLKTQKELIKEDFPQTSVARALDTLEKNLLDSIDIPVEDTINLNEDFQIGPEEDFYIAFDDLAEMELDSILYHYNVEGTYRRIMVRQKIKMFRQSDNFFKSLVNKVSWGVIFMMPFLALILKIIYIRRSRYYVEHLIFSFHMHALLFLMGSITLLVSRWIPPPVYISFMALGFPIYLFLSMQFYYSQPWWKTLMKYFILTMLYLILLGFVIALTFVVGFLLF